MLDFGLLGTRLSQYGAAWLAAFLLVFLGALGAHFLLHMDMIAVANALLGLALTVLVILVAVFVAYTLLSRMRGLTKPAMLLAGLILLLPLLWAPVLGAIAAAWIGHVTIEYSSVYAGFRIVLGRLLYGVTQMLFGNPYVEAAMAFFQGLATFVGFIASAAQIWNMLGRPGAPARVES